MELKTKQEITWCAGCTNFLLFEAVKKALEESKIKQEDIAISTGIGCHGKIFDYLNVSGVYGLHGRTIPTAVGIKLANPKLKVLAFAGDGDTYAEGMGHFVHICRNNPDITLIVHNNQVFALTTGQNTPTSEQTLKSKSIPRGILQEPINPIKLALASGAGFVARLYTADLEYNKEIIKQAIEHKGLSFIDFLQPCIKLHNNSEFLKSRIYKLDKTNHNIASREDAMERADEWNYNLDEKAKIPLGIFFKEEKKTYGENWI